MCDFHHSTFFLTYPRTTLDKEDASSSLLAILACSTTVPLQHHAVCSELHEDGFPHLHVLLTFERRLRVRDPNFFDLIDYDGSERHPNIQLPPRAKAKQWIADHFKYLGKDGEPLSTYPSNYFVGGGGKWEEILAEGDKTESVDEFMSIVRAKDPRSYYLHGEQIRRNRAAELRPVVRDARSMAEFQTPEPLMEWYVANFLVRYCALRYTLRLLLLLKLILTF